MLKGEGGRGKPVIQGMGFSSWASAIKGGMIVDCWLLIVVVVVEIETERQLVANERINTML